MIVLWRITTRCNLSCAFCAYDRTLPFPRTAADPATVRRMLDVLADFQQHRQQPAMISWLGGEPLLVPGLPSLTAHATSRGLRVSATTNGTALGSVAVRQHLLDHYAELTISLDALGETHDDIRHAPGLFATLREQVPILARRMKLRVNTVLLRSTIGDFPALAREVAAWGVDELTFNLLGGRDRPEFFPQNRPLATQFDDFMKQLVPLRAELAPTGLRIAGSDAYLTRLADAARDVPRPVHDCRPGGNFLFIDENGLISPCPFTSHELGVPLTELHSAVDLENLAARFASARRAARPAVCDNCPSTQVFEKFAHHAA